MALHGGRIAAAPPGGPIGGPITTANMTNYQRWRPQPSTYLGIPISSPNNHRPNSFTRSASTPPRCELNGSNDDPKSIEGVEEEKKGVVEEKKGVSGKQAPPPVSISLDDVNPVGLGRRSRQIFDEVWRKFSGLGQISRTSTEDSFLDSVLVRGPMCEFTVPEARDTTVLVIGATSRIGRIVVRKLMLRGYKVKALVRKVEPEVIDMLPRSVSIVVGDVGEPSTLKAAVEGCNKIIYCATARSAITGDLNRVDNQGVRNVTKAFQDYNNQLAQLRAGKSSKSKLLLAKFKSEETLKGWEVRQGTYFQDVVVSKYDGGMDAKFEFTESGEALFSGYVLTRGGYVELSKKLSLPLGLTLDRYDGLVLSVGGNGRSFVLILETGPLADTSQSKLYFARMNTKVGFCRVRVPFSSFRPVKPDDPPLDPFLVHTLTIRFEPRRQRASEVPLGSKQDLRSFNLIIEYIKALPTGQETDFILVSCTGSGIEPGRREQVLKAKKAGEDSLRRSGLGYTIVRPGPLQEEPGGQRALIFDQGNRISQGISCADVADICVKALHDTTARNKSFDVCYEYIAEQGLLDPAAEMKGAEIEDERATEVARRKMEEEQMKALKGKGVDNVVEAEEESEDDEEEVKDGGAESDEEEDADEEEEMQSGALDEEDEEENEDDEDEDSEDDDDDDSSDGEEDMGTEYLVQPVGRAEDEEDASDFEPDDEDSEDEDIEDEEDFESGSAGKVEASMKRKRSSDDGNDDAASGDDDEKPAKR